MLKEDGVFSKENLSQKLWSNMRGRAMMEEIQQRIRVALK
jgi:hypothetical protein